MVRLPNKLLLLLVSTPCLALACGPTPVTPAAAPVASAAIVVVPTAATETASVVTSPACVEPPGPRPKVADLDSWPDQNLIGTAADTSAPVRKACEKIAKHGALAEKSGPGGPDPWLDPISRCFGSAKGAWALDMSGGKTLEPDAGHSDPGWEVHYDLTYITPEGKLFKTSQMAGEISSRVSEMHAVEVEAVFDYDGDGVAEIIVKRWEDYGGEEYSQTLSIFTFHDGEVKPYAPAADIEIEGVLDADFDGRPDLVTLGPFHASGPCGLDGQDFHAPSHLAHSLPGGAFSLDDAVAREVVRVQCGPMPRDLVAIERPDGSSYVQNEETVRRITCARIYGMSAKEAAGRVRALYPYPVKHKDQELSPGDPGYCLPLKQMLELAAQSPTFTTEAPCPAN